MYCTVDKKSRCVYKRVMHRDMVSLSLMYCHKWAANCWSHYPWCITNNGSQTRKTEILDVDGKTFFLKWHITRRAITLDINWCINNFVQLFYFCSKQYETTYCFLIVERRKPPDRPIGALNICLYKRPNKYIVGEDSGGVKRKIVYANRWTFCLSISINYIFIVASAVHFRISVFQIVRAI